jgi:hypothetical protein
MSLPENITGGQVACPHCRLALSVPPRVEMVPIAMPVYPVESPAAPPMAPVTPLDSGEAAVRQGPAPPDLRAAGWQTASLGLTVLYWALAGGIVVSVLQLIMEFVHRNEPPSRPALANASEVDVPMVVVSVGLPLLVFLGVAAGKILFASVPRRSGARGAARLSVFLFVVAGVFLIGGVALTVGTPSGSEPASFGLGCLGLAVLLAFIGECCFLSALACVGRYCRVPSVGVIIHGFVLTLVGIIVAFGVLVAALFGTGKLEGTKTSQRIVPASGGYTIAPVTYVTDQTKATLSWLLPAAQFGSLLLELMYLLVVARASHALADALDAADGRMHPSYSTLPS